MLTTDQRTNIKAVPITSYLAGRGLMPVLEQGGEYCYFSPFHEERTPSFFVNSKSNVYKDFSMDEKGGDNLRLVMKVENCDFIEAVKILQRVDQSFEIELQENLPASPQYQSFIKRITPLTSKALISYIVNERKIDFRVAKKNLVEVHYTTSKGNFYSLGFKSESGGMELRNKSFKGCIGQKDISLRSDDLVTSNIAIVFEGFIDYLSFRTVHMKRDFSDTVFIILNSLSLVSRLHDLSTYSVIKLYLDNDDSGTLASLKLCEKYPNAFNMSKLLYPAHSDYNEYLISKRQHGNNKTTTH